MGKGKKLDGPVNLYSYHALSIHLILYTSLMIRFPESDQPRPTVDGLGGYGEDDCDVFKSQQHGQRVSNLGLHLPLPDEMPDYGAAVE